MTLGHRAHLAWPWPAGHVGAPTMLHLPHLSPGPSQQLPCQPLCPLTCRQVISHSTARVMLCPCHPGHATSQQHLPQPPLSPLCSTWGWPLPHSQAPAPSFHMCSLPSRCGGAHCFFPRGAPLSPLDSAQRFPRPTSRSADACKFPINAPSSSHLPTRLRILLYPFIASPPTRRADGVMTTLCDPERPWNIWWWDRSPTFLKALVLLEDRPI